MTLIERIKIDQIAARKAHNALATSLLTTLLGEALAVGKNKGNREPTDSEVIALVKKFTDNMRDTVGYLEKTGGDNVVALKTVADEMSILSAYVPQQMTESELTQALQSIVAEVGPNMGKVMGALKAKHEGLYDGKMASTLVKAAIAGV